MPAATGGGVGAGEDGDDLVAAGEQRVEGGDGDVGGPGEDETHYLA